MPDVLEPRNACRFENVHTVVHLCKKVIEWLTFHLILPDKCSRTMRLPQESRHCIHTIWLFAVPNSATNYKHNEIVTQIRLIIGKKGSNDDSKNDNKIHTAHGQLPSFVGYLRKTCTIITTTQTPSTELLGTWTL